MKWTFTIFTLYTVHEICPSSLTFPLAFFALIPTLPKKGDNNINFVKITKWKNQTLAFFTTDVRYLIFNEIFVIFGLFFGIFSRFLSFSAHFWEGWESMQKMQEGMLNY